MLIKRISQYSGKQHELDLPVTQEQLDRFEAGEHVQKVFPDLPAPQREFILTGITPEEWEEMFPQGEE